MRRTRRRSEAAGDPRQTLAPAPIDAALIEAWALAYLGRYASSAGHLRQVLQRRIRRRIGPGARIDAALAASIDALIARYRASGLLDDAAYAAAQARYGLARGRSLPQIAAGLAAKGVGAEDAAAALHEAGGEPALAAAAAFARRRRLGPYRREPPGSSPDSAAARQRALSAFSRAGFPRRDAERILACADEAAVAALLMGC